MCCVTDRRLIPANARVAASHLRGKVEAPRYESGMARLVSVPVADLLHAPGGRRERQLLMGAAVTVYDIHEGHAFVQAKRDGYVGYLPETALGGGCTTHRLTVRASHLYTRADLKSPEICGLSLGSRVQVLREAGRFAETPYGFIPRPHLAPLEERAIDPVAVAGQFLGTPYLWGGNSAFGLDCSGLVQEACIACGIACPGDSDLQEAALGTALPEAAPLRRGDLLFWKGHVAWVSAPDMLLHANAHHMAVAYEPLVEAIRRIEAGEGPVTSRRRVGLV